MTKSIFPWRLGRAAALSTVVLLLMSACGGGDPMASDPGQPAGPPAGSTTVGITGGKVATSDARLSLTIASGALKGDTYFKIAAQDTISGLPATYVLLSGTAYEIDWTGAGFAAQPDATLTFANPATGQVQILRMTARGPRPLSTSSTSAVVKCGDTSQVYVTATDPNASDYSDASVVLCSPTTGGGGPSGTQVGLVQPAPGQAPTITSQPANVSDAVGDTASFSVVAAAASNLSYQWKRDGVDITGAVVPVYSFTVAASDSGAKFSVVVSNPFGSVTSAEATLTVGQPQPPAAPQWGPPKAVTSFAPAIDLPQVGMMVDVDILAWNNNGVLDSDDATIHSRALPIRSRPKLLTGPNIILGYIVFVDDDGTSSCQTGSGNRLSAIAIGWSFEKGNFPPSAAFPLYRSTGDCIISFSAALSPDLANGITAIAFAAQEVTSSSVKVGVAGALRPGTVVNGVAQTVWTPTTPVVSALVTSADCANGSLTADGMMGIFQAPDPVVPSPTVATLAFVAFVGSSAEVCAAEFSGTVWSSASMVFDNASEAEPVVAIDGSGNSMVFASRIIDPTASVPSYAMTAGFRASAAGTWQVQGLDSSDAAALASAAFDGSGNAFVVWRPNSSSGKSAVYMTRHPAAGAWETVRVVSAPTAVETRFPRLCVDPDGHALALFEQNFSAGAPFSVFGRLWKQGLWSDIAPVQTDTNEGRFADCPRNANLFQNAEVAWLETDPVNAGQFRIVSAVLQSAP
jgi:hypothetical protein